MRVAMIDPSLFTPSYDQALASALAAAGHAVTLFGRRPGANDSMPAGVPLVELFYRLADSRYAAALPRGVRLGIKGLDHAWSMGRLLRRLRREAPDVIHFQWLALPVVDRRMLPALRRIAPLVLTMHDTNPFNGDPSSRLQALGLSACLSCFDRVIVHTEQGRDRLASRGVPQERVSIVPHGKAWPPMPPPSPDPMRQPLTFTLFGKIKPYKGADILVEAFASLPEPLRTNARLRIVGKSYMDLAPLVALARERGVSEHVLIEDRFVADDEVATVFGPGVVAVFPYREIESSGVLPQALAQGRPVIASKIGGFAEALADGVHGHLVPAGDPAAFAAAMAHLLQDRGFASECGARNRALSDNGVSWDFIAERTAALYREIAPARGRAASARGRATTTPTLVDG